MMHLLFDARLLHRPLSGLERVQRNLLRELSGHPEIGRLRALVRPGTKLPADLGGAEFDRRVELIEVARSEDILALLLHKDKDQRPDVYHLTWFPDREPWDVMLPLAASAHGKSASEGNFAADRTASRQSILALSSALIRSTSALGSESSQPTKVNATIAAPIKTACVACRVCLIDLSPIR